MKRLKTIIYFDNDKIILQNSDKPGEGNSQTIEVPLNEGTIVNGVIFDSQEIVEKLLENKGDIHGPVTFMLDSTNILSKRSDVPKLKKAQLRALIEDEFSYASNAENLVIDGIIERNADEFSAISYAIEYEKLLSYIDLAKSAGLKLKKIDTLTNCINKYVRNKGDFLGSTFIINILKESTVISMLFENDKYLLTSRNRLMMEKGTAYYDVEVFEKLTNIIQFSKSEKLQNAITASYYLGFDERTVAALRVSVREAGMGIDVEEVDNLYNAGGKDNLRIIATYALDNDKSDINFYTKALEFEKMKKKGGRKEAPKLIVLPIVLVALILAGIGYFFVSNLLLQNQLDTINQNISNLKNSSSGELELTEKNTTVLQEIASIEGTLAAVKAENHLNSVDLDLIVNMAEVDGIGSVESLGYEMAARTLTINGSTRSEEGTAEYVKALEQSGIFEDVSYSGWSGATDSYTYVITCLVKQGGQ